MSGTGWTSKTNQFGQGEMAMMEEMTAEELVPALLTCDPVVALRLLAEVMLNEDTAKLDALLASPVVRALVPLYETDHDVDDRDHEYARQLTARMPQ